MESIATKPKVLITRHRADIEHIPERYASLFHIVRPDHSPTVWTKEELMREIVDADGLVFNADFLLSADIIDKAKHLKIIANFGAGYDKVDVRHAEAKHIWVTNTPGVVSDATATLLPARHLGLSAWVVLVVSLPTKLTMHSTCA